MESVSATGKSTLLISGIAGFVAGTNGFFMIMDTGTSIYVPRPAVEPASVYDALVDNLRLAVKGKLSEAVSKPDK